MGKQLILSRPARIRLGEVFQLYEKIPHPEAFYLEDAQPYLLSECASRELRSTTGRKLEVDSSNLGAFCLKAPCEDLCAFIEGAYTFLAKLKDYGVVSPEDLAGFVEGVERVFDDDGFPQVFDEASRTWMNRVSSDAEALRRALLSDSSEAASCSHGDPQVEMVVSSVQTRLAQVNPVLVDYGAGLGRILLGFGAADRFRNALYVAVDEPVSKEVQELAAKVGADFSQRTREEFLAKPEKADVVILMNTLHHIPFGDVPRQIGTLLASLKSDGLLVVQEMGELREPEQRNVPWRAEDIIHLFQLRGCTTNPRTVTTRTKKVPLTHMLVHVEQKPPSKNDLLNGLAENCRAIWKNMKARTLDEIRQLYSEGNPDNELILQHLLFTNANLDLNKPS